MPTPTKTRKTPKPVPTPPETPASSTPTAATGHSPKKLWVRMYRVGFGDFFLIAVPTRDGPRYILMDCGVHAPPGKPIGDLGSIEAAVLDLAKVTGNCLSLIIVTHRHADHIAGFATCADQFKQFTVGAIWMSWWDDPANNQASAFQATLTALAAQAQKRLALRADNDPEALEALGLISFITGQGHGATMLGAAGTGHLAGNAAALALLRGVPEGSGFQFASGPKMRRYYQAGDAPELPEDLVNAGLAARILGPPSDHDFLKDTDSDPHQYLRLAGTQGDEKPLKPFGDDCLVLPEELSPAALHPYSPSQIEKMVQSVQPEALWAAAKKADNTINNQSLVVLLTFGGKNLLFVGDAQWGNWEGFLYGKDVTKDTAPKLQDDSQRILSMLDFYKVGHHGSTNATPMDAVSALRQGCVAMCSTQPGCYGTADKGTEVPRTPLLAALDAKTKSQLVRSDQVPAANAKPTPGSPAQLPAHFSTPGALYIDYEF